MTPNANILVAPLLLPMICAALCIVFGRQRGIQRLLATLTDIALVVLAFYLLAQTREHGYLVLRVGNWPLNQGIVFTLDIFGAIMLCLTTVVHLINILYARLGAASKLEEKFLYYPLFMLLGAGVNWAFITGDLFNLFVSFEIILLCSYILVAHGANPHQLREGFKFIVMNLVASTMFLLGAGLIYGILGTLNFADMALRARELHAAGQGGLLTPLGTVLLTVFAAKAALFPLFFWLPYAYPRASVAVIPYFAGLLTKVGVYALYRIAMLLYVYDTEWFAPLILGIAATSMIIGVLCALSRMSMRGILAFHIISQIGYMIFGLGLGCSPGELGTIGLAAGIFYMVHHIIVKSGLFFVAGCVVRNEGTDQLEKIKGLADRQIVLSLCFVFFAFSLAGIPPLSGFYGKYILLVEGFRAGGWLLQTVVIISIITSLLTLLSMVKIWRYAFWGRRKGEEDRPSTSEPTSPMTWPVFALALVSLAVAIFSPWVMQVARESAAQLKAPETYIEAVLGSPASRVTAELPSADLPGGDHNEH